MTEIWFNCAPSEYRNNIIPRHGALQTTDMAKGIGGKQTLCRVSDH